MKGYFMNPRIPRPLSRRQFLRAGTASALGAFAIGQSSRAETDKPCNILFFFPDQHRPDWAAWNPAIPVRTPNLMRLAKEGLRFDRAFCPAPVCAASRAALALGQRYGHNPVRGNGDNLPDGAVTFYARLRDAGYRVGSVGKLDFHKPAKDWGPDGLHRRDGREYFREWGFTDGLDSEGKGDSFGGIQKDPETGQPSGNSPYTRMLMERKDGSLEAYIRWRDEREKFDSPVRDYAFTQPIPLAEEAYNDNWVGHNGLSVLEGFPKDAPWFLQVNLPGPHGPMDITPAMAEWYKDTAFAGPCDSSQLTPETHTAIRRNYSAMVENIDRWLGRYLAAIDARGERGNTLIIYSSDHGEMLGDHNRWAKTVPYQPSAGVPLVAAGPEVCRGQVHHGPVETLDLAATILDYASVPIPEGMDSRSLRPLLRGESKAGRSHAYCALGEWALVCDGRYKLIRGFDPASTDKFSAKDRKKAAASSTSDSPQLLFDLQDDPCETRNVAEAQPEIVRRMSQWLEPRPVA